MAQVHAIRDGLDTASNDLDHVLEDQDGQVNLVFGLDVVHEPVVNLVHCGVLQPIGSKEMRYEQMHEPIM